MVMRRGRGLHTFALLLVMVSLSLPGVAQARTPTTVPFDTALSIYVGHRGTWWRWGEKAQAEIEDPVAGFQSWETISDDPDVWAKHQINLPRTPRGWLFFEPLGGEWWRRGRRRPRIRVHVIVRDRRNRLAKLRITERDRGQLIGTLQANPQGSQIAGCLLVDPRSETLKLYVTATTGQTLMKAVAKNPRISDAIAFMVPYGWEPNSGLRHPPCPAGGEEPFGDLHAAEGKLSTAAPVERRACGGPTQFHHDAPSPNPTHRFPKYGLCRKQIVKQTRYDLHFAPAAWQELRRELRVAQEPFVEDDYKWDVYGIIADAYYPWALFLPLQAFEVKAYSEGTGHWPMTLTGELNAVIYFPYRGRRQNKDAVRAILQRRVDDKVEAGVNRERPSMALAAAIAADWGPPDEKLLVLPPRPARDVWGLRAAIAGDPVALPERNITASVTIELQGRVPTDDPRDYLGELAPIGGTGTLTIDGAWLTPRPPKPVASEVQVTFPDEGPDKGRCTVQLGKGWKWKADVKPTSAAYSCPEGKRLAWSSQDTAVIRATLVGTVRLVVKARDRRRNPRAAYLELYREQEGQWVRAASGKTRELGGEQVWELFDVAPALYKIRMRGATEPDWHWGKWPILVGGRFGRFRQEFSVTVNPTDPPPEYP